MAPPIITIDNRLHFMGSLNPLKHTYAYPDQAASALYVITKLPLYQQHMKETRDNSKHTWQKSNM